MKKKDIFFVGHEKEEKIEESCPFCNYPLKLMDLQRSYYSNIILKNKNEIYGYEDLDSQSFMQIIGSKKEYIKLCTNCSYCCVING